MNKKSQAALEFMVSYGWAIMAALVIIGALGYYVLDFNKTLPNKCELGNLQCGSFIVTEEQQYETAKSFNGDDYRGMFGKIEFEFKNPELDTIDVLSASFKYKDIDLLSSCVIDPEIAASGKTVTISCFLCYNTSSDRCGDFLGTSNSKDKIETDVKYIIQDKTFAKHGQGEIIFGVSDNAYNPPECYDEINNDEDILIDQDDIGCLCTTSLEKENDICLLNFDCGNSDDCIDDLICDGSFICKVNLNGDCNDDNNCADPYTCIEFESINQCLDLRIIGETCDDNNDCVQDLICDDTNTCQTNHCVDELDNDGDGLFDEYDKACACGDGKYEEEACVLYDECNMDGYDCDEGFACDEGFCKISLSSIIECSNHIDCIFGEEYSICYEGICKGIEGADCTNNEECMVDDCNTGINECKQNNDLKVDCNNDIDDDTDLFIDELDLGCYCGDGKSEERNCGESEPCYEHNDCNIGFTCQDNVCKA